MNYKGMLEKKNKRPQRQRHQGSWDTGPEETARIDATHFSDSSCYGVLRPENRGDILRWGICREAARNAISRRVTHPGWLYQGRDIANFEEA